MSHFAAGDAVPSGVRAYVIRESLGAGRPGAAFEGPCRAWWVPVATYPGEDYAARRAARDIEDVPARFEVETVGEAAPSEAAVTAFVTRRQRRTDRAGRRGIRLRQRLKWLGWRGDSAGRSLTRRRYREVAEASLVELRRHARA